MSQIKIAACFTSALFPVAGLHLGWWLLGAAGKLFAGIAFMVLCVNNFLIVRNLKNLENEI